MTFALIFAFAMAWAPVLGVIAQTARVANLTEATRAAARSSVRRCVAVAGTATAALLLAWLEAPEVVGATLFAVPAALAAFHVGWWWGARPLLVRGAAQVAAERGPAHASRRVASLVPRDDAPAVAAGLWAVPVGIVVASAAAIVVALAHGRVTGATRIGTVAGFWTGGAFFLVAWGWWARAAGRTPQDLATAADATEADRLCREFRRFIVCGLFVGTTCAVLVFAGLATTLAWWDDATVGQLAGIAGGVGGGLVGLWGSVFGVLADRRRRAIIELGGVPPDVGAGRATPATG